MQTLAQTDHDAAGLHWLAFLLTGRRGLSIDIAAEIAASEDDSRPFFSTWMLAWSRRLVISRALAAIREELAASARRMKLKRVNEAALPSRDWSLDRGTTKGGIENALLAIDVFPRAALLLSVFERVSIDDAAVLMDADPKLVSKARTIGLRELTNTLARMQGWTSEAANAPLSHTEAQYA